MEEVCRTLSLDGEVDTGDSEQPASLAACLGTDDAGLQNAEQRVSLGQALRHLAEPLRNIIQLRYLAELSQREVARRLGLSQMQVSRLEKRALGQLRSQFVVN